LFGGLLSLRTFSVGLSLAAAVFVVALACMPSYSGPHPGDAILARAQEAGFSPGDPVMIRIFKRESQLELWMRKDDRFELFGTYPICFWSGKLGPKEHEGDRQAPEGFYAFTREELRTGGRHPLSINIGFPNAFDRAMGRTGSYILLHGGCTSIGCFAMTDPIMEEIYKLVDQALGNGQDRVQVQIFPFRMTEANLAPFANSKWSGFWRTLKQGYDAFESTRVPPAVSVCNSAYVVSTADPDASGPPSARVASDACSSEPPVVTASAGPIPKRRHLKARPRVASSHKAGKVAHGARTASRPIRYAAVRSFHKTAAAGSKRIR
jgi:murein L,D-transpeptidase YafK